MGTVLVGRLELRQMQAQSMGLVHRWPQFQKIPEALARRIARVAEKQGEVRGKALGLHPNPSPATKSVLFLTLAAPVPK